MMANGQMWNRGSEDSGNEDSGGCNTDSDSDSDRDSDSDSNSEGDGDPGSCESRSAGRRGVGPTRNPNFKTCICTARENDCAVALQDTEFATLCHKVVTDAFSTSAKTKSMKAHLESGLSGRIDESGNMQFREHIHLMDKYTVCVATWRILFGWKNRTVTNHIRHRKLTIEVTCRSAQPGFALRRDENNEGGVNRRAKEPDWRVPAMIAWLTALSKQQGDQMPTDGAEYQKHKLLTARRGVVGGRKGSQGALVSSDDSDGEEQQSTVRSVKIRVKASSQQTCVTCVFSSSQPPRIVVPMHSACGLCGCPACPSDEPNQQHDRHSAIIIIPFYSKREVYLQYIADFRRNAAHELGGEVSPLSYSSFVTEWKAALKHIKVTRVKSGWSRCDECSEWRDLLSKAASLEEKVKYRAAYDAHLQHQRDQRLKYYKHRQKAHDYPEKYCSIILDAMDQAKSTLPHVPRDPKAAADCEKLKQKVMGCLVHGYGMYLYLLSPPIKAGGNFAVHALARTIEHLRVRRQEQGHTGLPPTLYLQLDNASDNKNTNVMAFCDYLVTTGVFRKIKVSFLLVGHTHEDVDQYFRLVGGCGRDGYTRLRVWHISNLYPTQCPLPCTL